MKLNIISTHETSFRTLSLTDENRILSYAEKHGVRFSSILLPESGPALSFFDSAAAASGGRAFAFSTRRAGDVGAHLYANLIEAFQGPNSAEKIY